MASSKVTRINKRKPKGKIDDSRLPDGGWGWMVVLGVAVTNMFNQSLVSVFGLLFGEHLEGMGYESTGVALVSNVNNMVMCFSGLVIGPVLQRFSCRSVSIFGSILTFIGLVMCSFATTLTEILIYYSFLTGIGLGLIYPATFVAIKTYFVGRRARAVGLSMAGTGIGQMLMPQLVRWLLDEFNFCGSVRIVAALCLHGAVGSMLYQPVHWHLKPARTDSEALLNNNDFLKEDEIRKQKKENAKKENSNSNEKEKLANGSHEEEKNEVEEKEKNSGVCSWLQAFHFSLLRDPIFTNLCIGLGLVHTAGVSFGTLFPLLLQEGHLRLSRADTAMAMSLLSAADILARVSIPWIMWRVGSSSRVAFWWGALFLAGARSVIALQTTMYGVMAAALLTGYIRALTVINQNLTVSEYCTKKGLDDKLPAALGLMMVCKGIFVISLGQLLGWLRDYTKSYSLFVYGTNVLLIVVFISWGVEYFIKKMKRKEERSELVTES